MLKRRYCNCLALQSCLGSSRVRVFMCMSRNTGFLLSRLFVSRMVSTGALLLITSEKSDCLFHCVSMDLLYYGISVQGTSYRLREL